MKSRLTVKACLAAMALFSAGAPAHAQTAAGGMRVFVTAAPMADTRVDEETRKLLNARIEALIQTRKDLEKTLKAQYGGRRSKWPKHAEDGYTEAEEAVAEGNADWVYRRNQEGLEHSVAEIKRAIAGNGAARKANVRLVPSLEEAQLVVEVTGRRSAKIAAVPMPANDNEFWITFVVKAGPKLAAYRFAAVPRDYQLRGSQANVARLATARPGSPQWRFEAHDVKQWFQAANAVALLIDDFIAKNHDALTGRQ